MNDLGDLGQSADGPCADAGYQQKLGEIPRARFGGGGKIAVQASHDDVLGPDIVMTRHDEMRQRGLRLRAWTADAFLLHLGELALDPVGAELAQNVELLPARGFRTPIGQIDDHALFDAVDRGVRLVDEATKTF
jgi:hypothetical protein